VGQNQNRSLVCNDVRIRDDRAAVVGLGRSLGIVVTADGIETEEQGTLLRAAGCAMAQGDLFGRPAPNDRLAFAAYRDQKTVA
jgi:EAL domain-containing protein (putative c-di-GMP-specific phosphodiesterase class I)